jgi:hypothetical protein
MLPWALGALQLHNDEQPQIMSAACEWCTIRRLRGQKGCHKGHTGGLTFLFWYGLHRGCSLAVSMLLLQLQLGNSTNLSIEG